MSIDIKKELKNPFTQQYIAEILFPFVGYLFFDWSLLIIVVFYLLDQLASQLLFFKKLHFINHYWDEKNGWVYLLSSIFLFIITFGLELYFLNTSFAYISDQNGTCYVDELNTFAKNELWFLFPILLLMYFMQDKILFYVPKKFEQILSKPYFVNNTIQNLVVLIMVVVASFIYPFIKWPDIIIILCIVIVKLMYDFTIKKMK